MPLTWPKLWVILRQGAGRLRLHNWPALASHLFCLLLGVAWAQSRTPSSQPRWPWPVPAVVLAGIGDVQSGLRAGHKVAVEALVAGRWCRVGPVIGTLISPAKPAVVSFARVDLAHLSEALGARPAVSLRYIQPGPSDSDVCRPAGKVTYGRP